VIGVSKATVYRMIKAKALMLPDHLLRWWIQDHTACRAVLNDPAASLATCLLDEPALACSSVADEDEVWLS
jgi:hypothetical protein